MTVLPVGKWTLSQDALGELAVRVRGHAQLPVPVINNDWKIGLYGPCAPLKASELDEGCVSVQAGCTTRLIETTCPPPLAGA